MPRDELPEPPPPPETPRRLRLYAWQWVGLILLLLLPLLAAFGVLGGRDARATARGAHLEVALRYVARLRFKQPTRIEARVRNASNAPLDTVRIGLDSAFGARFSNVRATPPFQAPFELVLTRLLPGESRPVLIELEADRYGRHSGAFIARAGDTLSVPLRVVVFP